MRAFGKVDCTCREAWRLVAMLRSTPGCPVTSNGFVMLDLMCPIRVSTFAASLVMAAGWHSSCTGTVCFSWVLVMKCFIAAAYSPVMWWVRIHLIRAAFCLEIPAMPPFLCCPWWWSVPFLYQREFHWICQLSTSYWILQARRETEPHLIGECNSRHILVLSMHNSFALQQSSMGSMHTVFGYSISNYLQEIHIHSRVVTLMHLIASSRTWRLVTIYNPIQQNLSILERNVLKLIFKLFQSCDWTNIFHQ